MSDWTETTPRVRLTSDALGAPYFIVSVGCGTEVVLTLEQAKNLAATLAERVRAIEVHGG